MGRCWTCIRARAGEAMAERPASPGVPFVFHTDDFAAGHGFTERLASPAPCEPAAGPILPGPSSMRRGSGGPAG